MNHHRLNSGFADDLHSHSIETTNDDYYKQLIPLLAVSHSNKIDLGELMMTNYEQSSLSLNGYISRSSLFHQFEEFESENYIENMLKNYLNAYEKYICSPIPSSIHSFPSSFQRFNDKIDITLQYLTKISQCMNEYNKLIKGRPIQFDVYFVPPTAPNNLHSLNMKSMIKSSPSHRFRNKSGINDLYPMFFSEQSSKILNFIDSSQNNSICDKRLILLIVRKNKNKTNGDILYLFQEKLKYDLKRPEFKYNEILWKINTKKDIIPNKLNVDDPNYSIFSVSYHLHSEINKKVYFYFNGFGQRIFKRDIIKKWPLLFENDKNKISNGVLKEFNQQNGFNDFIESDKNLQIGQCLFGLRYSIQRCTNCKHRILTFPKRVLSNSMNEMDEFEQSQQLYYHLAWTCKMQRIDGEFVEYTLNDKEPRDIAIFNAELHEKRSNEELYVVAVLNEKNNSNHSNEPKWKMYAFMNAMEIYTKFGIDKNNLPIGSRYKHNYFSSQINDHNIKLHPNIYVKNWNKVPLIQSQKYKNDKPDFNNIDLNECIKESIDNICNNNNNDISLIPILNVDTKHERIYCNPLIPIKLRNEDKWIAVSYKNSTKYPYKTVVTGLYIDPTDIINKAALVDPNAIYKYQWLKGEHIPNNPALSNYPSDQSNQSIQSIQSNGNNDILPNTTFCSYPSNQSILSHQSGQSQADPSWIIQSLQQQLHESLKREKLLVSMLRQKDQQLQGIIGSFTSNQQFQNINISTTPININNFQMSSPIVSTPNNNNNNNNINIQIPSPPFNGFNNVTFNNHLNHSLITSSPSLSNNTPSLSSLQIPNTNLIQT